MTRWLTRSAITLAAWYFAAWWVLMKHRWEGRIVLNLSKTHGIHSHDPVGIVVAVGVTIAARVPWTRLFRDPGD